jgi:crotonobetainyl-CoA:carnitine CoA-transferase CaiB-like acyl-CoA transferase
MSGFGWTGPNRDYVVFAPVMQALSGLQAMVGHPGREPAGYGFSYSDHVAGYWGALAVLAGLAERDHSGEAIRIDLGQVEASMALTGPAVLDWQANGTPYAPPGNVPAGSNDAPVGLYPCAGDDMWCAITVRNDAQWQSLVALMARPELATAPRFRTSTLRAAQREAIDAMVAAWTRPHDRGPLVELLRKHGVPASPMQMARDLVEDSAILAERGYFATTLHPVTGQRVFQMGPIASPFGPELRRAAPVVGEANEYIYRDVLGMGAEQLGALQNDVVV